MFLSLTRVPCSDLLEMCIILNIYFSLYTIMFCKVLKHKQNIRIFWGKEANTNTICSPVSLFALSSSSRNELLHQCVSYHITTSSSWGIKAHFSYHSLCNLSNYVSFSCSVVHVFFSWHTVRYHWFWSLEAVRLWTRNYRFWDRLSQALRLWQTHVKEMHMVREMQWFGSNVSHMA